jgi:rubrerythrin
MQLIYTARDDMDAHFLQGLLEQEGITAMIQGEALEGAWGNMPVSAKSLPGVWVDETDVAKATPIVEEYQMREDAHLKDPDKDDNTARPTWKCPKCGEEVEDQFDECWNCGADRPGSEGAQA